MHKKEFDIIQIRKYLNGELDAKAMHQLERRAQNDPFLMDALEGYDHIRSDQHANLDQISECLKQRIKNKGGRIILWRYLAAAASILVVLTIGGLLLYNRHPANKQRIADIVQPVATDTIADAKPKDEENKTIVASKSASASPAPPVAHLRKLATEKSANVTPIVAPDNMAVNKPENQTLMDSSVQEKSVAEDFKQKESTTGSVAAATPQGNAKQGDITGHADKALQGRAAGVIADNFSKKYLKEVQIKSLVTGRVIERDGLPLSGATVMIGGTKVATVTNVDGFFTIRADTSKDKLYIANLGYQSRQISAHNRDSLATIKLNPDDKALAEVVVVGYGSKKKDEDDVVIGSAHPDSGWENFNKYLKERAVSPDGSTGVVKLSFEVAAGGAVSDIIVEKGLSKTANQKAIDLVNNGPAWVGNTNGKPEKVTVKVKFVKAK